MGDLFDRIRKTMPQSNPGRLTRQQDADILAFLLSVNKFPAGKTELYRQSEMLREIRFESAKPAPRNKREMIQWSQPQYPKISSRFPERRIVR